MAISVLLGLIAIWLLLRPAPVRFLPWDSSARQLLRSWGAHPDHNADGVVLGGSARAAIPFRRYGSVLLGLGDPVGQDSDRIWAIWRLRDLAHQEGLDAAVWGAGPELLRVYGDLGLTALPLGSDLLPMPEPEGSFGAEANHYLVCVVERDLALLLPVLPTLAKELRRAEPVAV